MFEILVIDDDKNTRRLMNAILLGAGYTPVLAEDGKKIHPSGHIVLRVYKGGKEFQIFVLDDTTTETPTIIYKSDIYTSRN